MARKDIDNMKRLEGAKYGESKSPKIWNGHLEKNSECNCDEQTKYTYWIVETEFRWSANTRQSENE